MDAGKGKGKGKGKAVATFRWLPLPLVSGPHHSRFSRLTHRNPPALPEDV
jgi:hypothetical protein